MQIMQTFTNEWYCLLNGAPYNIETKDQAERYVRTIKKKLKLMNGNRNILLQYRKMIHPSTGRSRLDLMMIRLKWNNGKSVRSLN